jgi:hypothetical protein
LFGRPSDLGRSRAAAELRFDGGAESVGAACVPTLQVQANALCRKVYSDPCFGQSPHMIIVS